MSEELKKFIKKVEMIADKIGKRPFQTLDIVIDFYADILKKGETKVEYKEYQFEIAKCGEELTSMLLNNPFKDMLGRAREELGSTNKKYGQFYTPTSISNSVYALIDLEKNGESKSFSDICCGTGSLNLPLMQHRENTDDYFLFVDKDEIALQALVLHIFSGYKKTCKDLPFIEIICGDGLFLDEGHEIIFSNTKRHKFDIPIIRKYGLYKEEIKNWDLMKMPISDVFLKKDY